VAAVRVAKLHGKIVINPSVQDYPKLEMSMVVAGTADAIVMVEGEAKEVPEKEVLEALFFAHAEIQQLIKMQLELQKTNGRPKVAVKVATRDEKLISEIEAFFTPKLKPAVKIADKLARRDALAKIKEEAKAKFITKPDDEKATEAISKQLSKSYEDLHYKAVRGMAFQDKVRIDGRDFTTVRPISIEVGVLPRSHGSALFQRGETQAIVVTTFGTNEEAQRVESLNGEESKRFMLHYNFPPFSVGETKPMRGPGRREVGHGFLAERAVKAILPEEKAFPYVIRIVSEVTESNGSSSMATVCGSSLALMEAGVPIKAPVAGVAMGLMQEGKDSVVLTDILGDEDHLGDMDFKVCGTEKGITALQMDIKIKGLDQGTMSKAMDQAREARIHILKQMTAVISAPKSSMSQYAPKIVSLKINPEKIRDVIGPGGKMIRSITESCGVKIEVTDDGTVNVSSNNNEKIESALTIIKSLTAEAEPGKIYRGIVKRIADFGAFVEIFPGTDGLVHISQLADSRVNRVTDVVNEGDEVYVKCLEVDRQGKIRLSLKDALAEMAQKAG
jgi:polyribonucleotide nucleotidyltransferase